MTVLSDAHAQWHRAHGKYATCDLDCGAGEIVGEVFEADAETLQKPGAHSIRCGACCGRHATVVTVKFCHEVKFDAEMFERNEAAMIAEIEAAGLCEHELSAALCAGFGHYPL